MRIIHFCAGLEGSNGMANTARQFVEEELAAGHDSRLTNNQKEITGKVDAVQIHGAWLPVVHAAARRAKKIGAKLVVRPAGSYDPIRLRFHCWKKRLMAPWEHAMLQQADVVLATCPQEVQWIRAYHPDAKIELTDLKRFFRLDGEAERISIHHPLRVLYLGRRHPLKGVRYLEQAVAELNGGVELRVESNVFGEEKESAWMWCDVLCLPTLSENFGRVVAEALERGKRVITTDGAPVWESEERTRNRLVYLRGYREGTERGRVELLKGAIGSLVSEG